LASHGIVVIAPDHRDGSAPISYIRETEKAPATIVDYLRIAHKPSAEVYDARNEQLRIRLWEQSLVHAALLKIDTGTPLNNLDPNHSTKNRKRERSEVLSMFTSTLDVHRPGAITWAGHSFGATTTVQLVKSTFYHASADEKAGYVPLFHPDASSALVEQITPQSPVMLLDLWCLPLQGPTVAWLRNKPMPCYAPSGPGGTALLAVASEAFFKWRVHLDETKRVLSESPGTSLSLNTKPGPRFFYPVASAHLSQSDFGILFPWVTTNVFGAREPGRVLRLNVRAMLQVMRERGIEVADTSFVDLEETGEGVLEGKTQDWKILEARSGTVRGWIPLTTELDDGREEGQISQAPSDAVVEGEVLGETISREDRRESL
jgi:platelet-activating factor acetylhydrolase